MRPLYAASLFLAASCVPTNTVTPLGPQAAKVNAEPRAALQSAVRTLTLAGYDVTVSDVDGGVIAARRTAPAQELREQVICKAGQNSLGESMTVVMHNLTVSAKDAEDGSEVVITPRVVASIDPSAPPAFRTPANEKDCASTGALERQIMEAMQRSR